MTRTYSPSKRARCWAGILSAVVAFLVLTAWAPQAGAFEQWSVDRNTGNCAECHGNFRTSPYTSNADGTNWGDDLHDVHRNTMLSGDCNTCHSSASRFPVFLNSSVGGTGLEPIACVGCHGRNEDVTGIGNRGAGLRQHHWNSGIALCADCHADSDPVAFTTVAESTPPPYYFTPDTAHLNKPTDACDANGTESLFGTTGLDNDGDLLYDGADSDCVVAVPDINPNPGTLDFGVVFVSNTGVLTTQIENLGTADLTVTGIGASAGTSAEFTFTAPATPFIVPAGGTQAVQVSYSPVDVGLDTGSLEIASDDPDEATVAVALSGTGEVAPTPDINLVPVALDFGTVFLGSFSTLTADIQNLGNADLTVTSTGLCVGTSAEFSFTADATPFIVPAGGSRMVSATYTPAGIGTDTGCLEIQSDDPDEATVLLDLTGTGAAVPIPDINLNPVALDFGTVTVGNSGTLSSSIQNLGSADLTVTGIAPAAGTSAEYGFTAPAVPFTIPAGNSQAVSVTYTPTNTGTDTGSLEIASDDPDEPTSNLSLTGAGAAVPTPDINLNPVALDFGVVTLGNSLMLTSLVENVGTANLAISAINLCAGTSSEFVRGGLPINIAAGASASLNVTYTPVNEGTDTGCIAISSNDPDEATVNLDLAGTGAVVTPDINLNPVALDFGAVTIGNTASLTTQIENLGASDLTVTGVTLGSGTSTEFGLTAPGTPFVIPAGGSQTVTVSYVPFDLGMDTGSVEVSSDDPDEPTVAVALSGTGEAAPTPDINLAPMALDFGTVAIGNNVMQSADIQNLGNADLTVVFIGQCVGTSAEFDFTADMTPFVIPPGGTRAVPTTYTPVDVGTDTGCLEIQSDDPDESVVELGLTGSGIEQPAFKEVNVKVPRTINLKSRGVTPIKFWADMDLAIAEVTCGPAQAMPKRLNTEDFNHDGFVDVIGLFKTQSLGIERGDRTLMCSGILVGGTAFEGTSNRFRTVGRDKDKDEDDDDDDDKDHDKNKDKKDNDKRRGEKDRHDD